MMRRSFVIFLFVLLVFVFASISYAAKPPVEKYNFFEQTRRTLKSASEFDYPPFSIINDDGTADGFSVDLLKAVAKAVGLTITFETGPWEEIKQKLINKELDLLPLVSYSAKRDKVIDFTAPYLRMHGTIFVRKGEKSILSETDLKNKEVLVMQGDTAHEYAIKNKLSNKLILTKTFEEAMQLLSAGKHDAIIIQHLVGLQLIKKLNISNIVEINSFKDTSLKLIAKPLSGFEQKFCFAVKEGDNELLALLNEGLAIVTTDGTYNKLYNKWFTPILPAPAVSFRTILKYTFLTLLPVLFIIGIFGIWYLKKEVARKTKFLKVEMKKREIAEEFQKIDLKVHKAMAEIAKELLSDNYDIKTISDILIKRAKTLTESRYGVVSSVDNNTFGNVGHTLSEIFSANGESKEIRAAFPFRKDGKYNELWDLGLNTNEAFFTNSLKGDSEDKDCSGINPKVDNFLAVPVMIGDSIIGLIALGNSVRDYIDQDIQSIERLSELFALAIRRKEHEAEKARLEQNLLQLQKIEAIGALAGGIAHDFNNILFPIVGFAEMLEEDLPEGSQLRDNTNEILSGAKRAKDLVKQILTFSQQAEREIVPLKPHLIIKEVIKLIRSVIPASIKIKQSIDPETWKILADPTQIHQVAMNLITNSYHAMQESGGVLTVKLQNIEAVDIPGHNLVRADVPHILFSVSDTGCGMEENTIKKIFNPYFTTKSKGKGTGLGLSVVHGIITNCKGDIRVDSTIGEGTIFEVYIPAFKESLGVNKKQHKTDIIPTGNERILLVDDEKQILTISQMILERLGYKVETRNSSLEALKTIKENFENFDLIISDMTMPDMSGDQLATEILKVKPDMPIIICTGFSERISLEKAKSIGVKALMMKPIIKSRMAVTVREVLDGVI